MVSPAVFREGLHALAAISGAQLGATTEGIWREATRELTDAQWRHGVACVIKSWQYPRMPPPAAVIEAAYTMPPPVRDMSAVIRPSGEFWETPGQRAFVEQVVRDNPRRDAETPLQYIHRIAVLSGLIAGDAK